VTFAERFIARVTRRAPDFLIGGAERPYIRRWWVIPRNRFFNVYLHHFLRSDDDRALHDHPWVNCSILLRGGYVEHTVDAYGAEHAEVLYAPDIRFRASGKLAHRIELLSNHIHTDQFGERPCWTLFITGPRYREWGFHCSRGWVHWKLFTATDDIGAVGKGCDQ
jgi:hypothetical protein